MTDYLFRQPYIDLLKSIIVNQKDNPTGYSFAIDGEWGSGKTWILQELEKQLLEEKDNNYLIFHYNAWENDFYDEPLVAILSVMLECLKKEKTRVKEKGSVKKVINSSITTLTKIAGAVVEKKWNINPNDVIESIKDSGKEISDAKLTKSDFNDLLPLENALNKIRDVIKNLFDEQSIIFIVDELDRCLPEYAIKVLERLHHVCNEIPVIQIQAINKLKLAESIAQAFGKTFVLDEDYSIHVEQFADSYLQKFVDMVIPLPNGILDNKLEILNGLEQLFIPYIRKDNGGQDYIIVNETFLISFITTVLSGLSRRLQEKIFKQVELCHKLTLQIMPSFDKEHITYTSLIYEILSCICQFVFHFNRTCRVSLNKSNYQLEFFQSASENNYLEKEYEELNERLKNFFSKPIKYADYKERERFGFEINDTKSYIMGFFVAQTERGYDSSRNDVWHYIDEDREFLDKFDEIMHLIT